MEADHRLSWAGMEKVGTDRKGHQGTFGGEGNVLFLGYGGGHADVYLSQNSLNCTF